MTSCTAYGIVDFIIGLGTKGLVLSVMNSYKEKDLSWLEQGSIQNNCKKGQKKRRISIE